MTHVTCRLTAKNRDQPRNPTLGNRVWATFTFFTRVHITNSISIGSVISAQLTLMTSRQRDQTVLEKRPLNGCSFPGLPRWAGTRKVKPIWILLKQETVCGSGISWAICKSAPCSRQTTTPAPHHSVFYRPDTLPTSQPTASKHWRHRRPAMPKNLHLISTTNQACAWSYKAANLCRFLQAVSFTHLAI